MLNVNNIWSTTNKVLLVIHYTELDDLKKYREAIKNSGLNVHECTIVSVVESKKEKDLLGEQASVVFINEKEINLFGKLKNKEAEKVLKLQYDLEIIIGKYSKKINKQLSKVRTRMSVGLNSNYVLSDINLITTDYSPNHLINFTKQTLEKIN